jgi:hypothetical protein
MENKDYCHVIGNISYTQCHWRGLVPGDITVDTGTHQATKPLTPLTQHSMLMKADLLTTKPDLSTKHTPSSIPKMSPFPGEDGGVDISEGCLVTKSIKTTHQLMQWVDTIQDDSGKAKEIVREAF